MPRPVVVDGVEFSPPQHGHNLPPAAFTSPGVFEIEQRTIFARSWVHVADVADLPGPGSYVAASIGRTPVILSLPGSTPRPSRSGSVTSSGCGPRRSRANQHPSASSRSPPDQQPPHVAGIDEQPVAVVHAAAGHSGS